jgi:3-oxoacyl-[acyl-carrier-protein] synthase-3
MNLKAIFNNFRIEGICTVIPSNKISFDEEVNNYSFTKVQSGKLKSAFGLNERRVVSSGVCASDLAFAGLEEIFSRVPKLKEQIGALLFISQTPDYLMPPTSNILQCRLGLSENVYCLDINQGCAGFIIGLFQAYQLLSTTDIKKVAIVNADALSVRVSKRDRNSRPLVGDAAAVTIVGRSAVECRSMFNINMDGAGAMALTIPAGGARLPADATTSVDEMDAAGNFRSQDNLVMIGDAVFNFVQTKVPPRILESL